MAWRCSGIGASLQTTVRVVSMRGGSITLFIHMQAGRGFLPRLKPGASAATNQVRFAARNATRQRRFKLNVDQGALSCRFTPTGRF